MGRRGERAVAGRERAGKRSADAVRVPATQGNGEGEVGNRWVEINGVKGRSGSGATDLEELPSPASRCVLAGVWLRFVTGDVSCRPMGCCGGARVGGERLCCFLGTSGLCSRAPALQELVRLLLLQTAHPLGQGLPIANAASGHRQVLR